MHIELDDNSSLIKALEDKRKRLGYTTCKASIIKAIQLFMDIPEPAYLKNNKSEEICSGCRIKVDDNMGGCTKFSKCLLIENRLKGNNR